MSRLTPKAAASWRSMVVKLKCWMNRGRNVRVFSAKSAKALSGLLMRWWLKLLYGEEPLS